ncbi:MAG: helix-turn-helix transcriptional regulator [Nocardioides sp.]|nr:helix-turn-helix transcriptional regulator [Nocardioides sp.]
MSRLHQVTLDHQEELAVLPGPRWVFVRAGAIVLEAPEGRERIGTGDAVMVDARTPHRIHAAEPAVLAVADLRTARPGLPSPLVVRCFATRHPGLVGLVGSCPQQEPDVGSAHFTQSYGNLIAAAMTASWREDRGAHMEEQDPAVATVTAALTECPGRSWTVAQMAALVHLSRSALGARFRRVYGHGPAEVLREIRMQSARRMLGESSLPVDAVASRVGYGSAAAFTRAFAAYHGVPPQTWRRGQAPEGARTAPKPMPAAAAATAPTTSTTSVP